MKNPSRCAIAAIFVLSLVTSACRGTQTQTGGQNELSGTVSAAGSSTVFLITQAIAEEFDKEAPKVEVDVAEGGTGGGFKIFCGESGEKTDISDASRPIKDEEKALCEKNGVEYLELQIAIDGLSVMTHPNNKFATCLTVPELKTMFEPNSRVTNWKQIRPAFPETGLKLYSPGDASGTFDYFTEEIVGKGGSSRSDKEIISFSENDNDLVTGIAGSDGKDGRPLGLGYFGFGYYEQNKAQLKVLGLDDTEGKGCVTPTRETILDGTYSPLSRPLFIYVNKESAGREEVKAFVDFYLENVSAIAPDVGYVARPEEDITEEVTKWEAYAT